MIYDVNSSLFRSFLSSAGPGMHNAAGGGGQRKPKDKASTNKPVMTD
jgi:hypothetical protein